MLIFHVVLNFYEDLCSLMKKHIRKNKDGMKSEDNLLYLFVSGIEERTQGIKLQEGNLPLPLIMSLYIHIAKLSQAQAPALLAG